MKSIAIRKALLSESRLIRLPYAEWMLKGILNYTLMQIELSSTQFVATLVLQALGR